jgi:ribonuclease HII
MKRLDAEYPGYGFTHHKGYGTKEHMEVIQLLGFTPPHHRCFVPIREFENSTVKSA